MARWRLSGLRQCATAHTDTFAAKVPTFGFKPRISITGCLSPSFRPCSRFSAATCRAIASPRPLQHRWRCRCFSRPGVHTGLVCCIFSGLQAYALRYYRRASPIPPSCVQRKVQPAVRAAERCRVGVELGGVAFLFPVQEAFNIGSLVPAGLVVHYPPLALRIVEHAIDHIVAIPRTNTELAVRLGVRSEHPAAFLVGNRVSQSLEYPLSRRFQFGTTHASRGELAAYGGTGSRYPSRVPALQFIVGDAMKPRVDDSTHVPRCFPYPGEFDLFLFPSFLRRLPLRRSRRLGHLEICRQPAQFALSPSPLPSFVEGEGDSPRLHALARKG